MNFITKFKVKRALQIKEEPKEYKFKFIFSKIIKFIKFIIWKLSFIGLFAEWLNKQAFGTIVAIFTLIVTIAIIIANQLRFYYWQNIMRSNYPNDVLAIVDKILFEFNAPIVTLHYWLYTLAIIFIIVTINNRYGSPKPQVIPKIKK